MENCKGRDLLADLGIVRR